MADGRKKFFANQTRAKFLPYTAAGVRGTTAIYCGILRNVEATVSWEFVPLYGIESTRIQGIAKHSQKVEWSAKYGSWDPVVANDIFGLAMADGEVEDTNVVKQFDLEGYIQATEQAATPSQQHFEVIGCWFENMPIVQMQENEWLTRDLKGNAVTVKVDNVAQVATNYAPT